MKTPLIGILRQTHLFMRSTAALVLLTFSLMVLQPTIAAAQAVHNGQAVLAAPPKPEIKPDNSPEAKLSGTLQQIEKHLAGFETKQKKQQDTGHERGKLKNLHQTLRQLDVAVRKDFDQVEKHIQDQHLPALILKRHRDMVGHYRQELKNLSRALDGMESSNNDNTRLARAQKAHALLKARHNKRSQQPFDPAQLPNASLKAKATQKPKLSQKEFISQGLTDTPAIQLAALGDFTFDKLIDASNPAFLAESTEVTLSQAVKDKAAELSYDPVKIYNWVRNTIEWQPTWGGIQDADLTLSAQRGNAMDTAGLLIALLRAAKIPARYVHGTVEVEAEAFKNWAGGFTDLNAALDFAASGGIPVTPVVSGGKISKVRIEHVWVEAAIDFIPSRGANNKDADAWVALDPSYKQYNFLQGLDAVAISGVNPAQLAQDFTASGTVNDTDGWATGFNPAILQTAQTDAQQKLQTYIQNNLSNPTVGDVIGGRKTIIQDFPVLMPGLPNKVLVTGSRYDKLPAALQQKITYAFGTDALGEPLEPISFPFAKLNNQKITLSFKPASAADEQTLQSLLPQGQITDLSQLPTSIPAYLIQVVPELKVNGVTVKTGAAMKLGEELAFITDTSFAGRGQLHSPDTYKVLAGSYLVVNAYAGSVSPKILQGVKAKLEATKAKLESADQTQIAALTREDLLGDMFHAGGLGYYAQYTALSYLMGLQSGAHNTLAAGTGTYGYEPNVDYFFGFPRSLKPGGVAMDIPLRTVNGVNDGSLEKKKQFNLQTGLLSSTLEHAVPEQMFTNAQNPGEAISAVKALQKANAAGQRIYHITPANKATTLPNIHHDQATLAEISNALNAGKEVITHTDAVSVPGWSGAGYIIFDPATGDGAYKIAGGGNGSFFLGLIVGAALISILALVVLSVIGGGGGVLAVLAAEYLGAELLAGLVTYLAGIGSLFAYIGLESYFNSATPEAKACFWAGIIWGTGLFGILAGVLGWIGIGSNTTNALASLIAGILNQGTSWDSDLTGSLGAKQCLGL